MTRESKQEGKAWQGSRSKKRLKSAKEATVLNREYNARMWEDIVKGEQFIFGYGPMELFNSMGLYLVLPVTYGSVLAAKQMYDYYQGKLEDQGYFSSLSNYESLPLGYCFDKKPEIAPYGGLPKPSAVVAGFVSEVATYELYAREFDCPIYFMEDPYRQTIIPHRWWECPEWRDSHIIDFCVRELEGCVRFLESVTGKRYSDTRLREYLDRADEMAEYYWKISDLACTTIPAPISATDCYSEVAVFETHFGEEWALEHVKNLYAEVKEKVDNGEAVCANEKVRLLWASTPLWFNLGFYNTWEESHDAVFLETLYLPRGQWMIQHDRSNPIRANFLRRHMKYSGSSPMAASELCIDQAIRYKADGVILPRRGASRDPMANTMFVAEALNRAGIPTLTLDYQPLNSRAWDDAEMRALVTKFIESLRPKK
ncbi:MAG: 2-hydroxyacyl-CoA dehydratase [Deltaproteobacteria bacterium]|nr:2-hydroxyacyl-CoA dehydratase [Deltaproteobacteria bacterium]